MTLFLLTVEALEHVEDALDRVGLEGMLALLSKVTSPPSPSMTPTFSCPPAPESLSASGTCPHYPLVMGWGWAH